MAGPHLMPSDLIMSITWNKANRRSLCPVIGLLVLTSPRLIGTQWFPRTCLFSKRIYTRMT